MNTSPQPQPVREGLHFECFSPSLTGRGWPTDKKRLLIGRFGQAVYTGVDFLKIRRKFDSIYNYSPT